MFQKTKTKNKSLNTRNEHSETANRRTDNTMAESKLQRLFCIIIFFIISINKTLNATQVSISNRLIMNQLHFAVIQIKF